MIPKYALPDMTAIWSDEHRFRQWLQIEVAVVQAWGDFGVIPAEDVRRIEAGARVNASDVLRHTIRTRHEVTAFLRSVAESLGPESRWIHYGLTSSDVSDTATCLQMRAALDLIGTKTARLRSSIARRAVEHMDTVCIGRTHGMHAEPTTFGMKLAVWVEELRRHEERLALARVHVSVGQMSGPVGTHASIPLEVERGACRRLGLDVAKITSQVIQRDRHAFFLSVLAGIGASLEKFATEIRNLQRTDIFEVEEPFDDSGETGSSSMPHKRNPEVCERVCGIGRTLRGYSTTGFENVALWHERDISHSSAERIILPDATGLLDYALHTFTGVTDGLVVYPDRMLRNLEKTNGLIFSSKILNALIESGMERQIAHEVVQKHAMRAWRQEVRLRDLIEGDSDVRSRLDSQQLDQIFDPRSYLVTVGETFRRLGLLAG